MGDALEALRIVAVLARPAVPAHLRRDLAPHRPRRRRPPTSGCPAAAAWGGYPGGLAVEKGEPLFPRIATPAS